jgi:glutathione S-transferase
MQLTLVIGSRNLSSWSFRAWLALRQGGVPFEEVVVALKRPDTALRVAEWSPSGKVPVLVIDGRPVWESLAICELAAELVPALWPADPMTRAHARSVSAEMHSGFAALRRFLPMDFVARFAAPGRLLRDVARDVARIEAIWADCRQRHAEEGPFLFGEFSVADAMYAPVVSRFLTYDIELGESASAYVSTMRSLPAWEEWAAAAAAEVEQGPARSAVAAWSTALSADPAPVASPGQGPGRAAMGAMGSRLMVGAASLAGGPAGPLQPGARSARQPRPGEIKPIGDGIHRRR